MGKHLVTLVADFGKHGAWEDIIPMVQRIINFSYHSSIGTYPAELMYGRSINDAKVFLFASEDKQYNVNKSSLDFYSRKLRQTQMEIQRSMQKVQEDKIKKRLENQGHYKDVEIKKGDLIIARYPDNRPSHKLRTPYRGPFIVTCQEINSRKTRRFHIEDVKLFHERDSNNIDIHTLALADSMDERITRIIRHK